MKVFYLGKVKASYAFALEEALLEEVEENLLLLWSTPATVMIGRFQSPYKEIHLPFVKENNIDLVRRNSGGGAIYTDEGVLQFSFFYPKEKKKSFAIFMAPVVELLRESGIPATVSGRNDILVHEKKVCGNAQFENRKAVVHHGSILVSADLTKMEKCLNPSHAKLSAKGVNSVKSRVGLLKDYQMTVEKLVKRMEEKFLTQRLHFRQEVSEKAKAYEEKFLSVSWNYGKVSDADRVRYKKYSSGEYMAMIYLKDGVLRDLVLEGDFFLDDEEKLLLALRNTSYEREKIQKIIEEKNLHLFFQGLSKEELLNLIIEDENNY